MSMNYTRIITQALREPWALTPDMMAVVWDVLQFRARGGRLTPDEIRARIGDDEASARPRDARTVRTISGGGGGAIAVIPVYGVIAHRTFEASSGMTSTEGIGAMLSRAMADPEVGTIVLDIASPGGTVSGVPELASQIYRARSSKRIVAVANSQAASAAYWLGSQASEFVAIPSGSVGSIGVFSLHEDWSKWLEKEGVSITPIQAGARKLEGAPWAPLDAEAKSHFQASVDDAYRQFTAAVAKGRGVPVADVRGEGFGEGRSFDAPDAKARGLIDDVATLEETIARLAKDARGTASGPAHAFNDHAAMHAEHEHMEMLAALTGGGQG